MSTPMSKRREPVGPYCTAVYRGQSASGKTSAWDISASKDYTILGIVAWFGRWRKYAFFPHMDTVYESVCLNAIAEFCARKTKEQRRRTQTEEPEG